VTDAVERDLGSMLDDLCRTTTTASFARSRGDASESPTRPGGCRITCPPGAPFAFLDLRRWDDDGIGIVDVTLRSGAEQPTWARLRERFGPFEELDPLEGADPRFAATWAGPPESGADALVIVTVDAGVVTGITLRRDPRRVPPSS